MESTRLDEEARGLLRRIVESQAWRQLMAINMQGHCLKYIPEVETKLMLAEELGQNLRLFRELQSLYAGLGWTDIESVVREKLERIPYPGARLEYGLCRYLCELAEQVAMRAYVDSASSELAAIARSYLEAPQPDPSGEHERFAEYCREPGNRPHAQQLFNHWLGIALRSFGRPGTRGDARAVALGLRSTTAAAVARQYLDELRPFMQVCGLTLAVAEVLGVELPRGVASAKA